MIRLEEVAAMAKLQSQVLLGLVKVARSVRMLIAPIPVSRAAPSPVKANESQRIAEYPKSSLNNHKILLGACNYPAPHPFQRRYMEIVNLVTDT